MAEKSQDSQSQDQIAYRVLARKYRPRTFQDLIGQEPMVKTLNNASKLGRLAHAFMLTGVRGVGKTTTARIIARALNCESPLSDETYHMAPCGKCSSCETIFAGTHVDVLEMDAATRTSVEDIRDIIDGVRYAPVSAKYKIYIIDEVHMLSKAAFNALLKTLEEPPERVKFIFATTEIRKVPLTILSRCQRFDLRRVDMPVLQSYFKSICDQESVEIEDEALYQICKSAEGSVRDGLSLLDQAIAISDTKVTFDEVKMMLGLSDRTQLAHLLTHLYLGEGDKVLDVFDALYRNGADPTLVLQDLAEAVHHLSRLKVLQSVDPEKIDTPFWVKELYGQLQEKLTIPSLTRLWQVLTKGLQEVSRVSLTVQSVQMTLIKALYASRLPDPAQLIESYYKEPSDKAPQTSAVKQGASRPQMITTQPEKIEEEPQIHASLCAQENVGDDHADFRAIVNQIGEAGEPILYGYLYTSAHPVKCVPGILEFRPKVVMPSGMINKISAALKQITGRGWMVSESKQKGLLTLSEQDRILERQKDERASEHPMVRQVLQTVSGAKIYQIYPINNK